MRARTKFYWYFYLIRLTETTIGFSEGREKSWLVLKRPTAIKHIMKTADVYRGVQNVYLLQDTCLCWLQLARACNKWRSVLAFCGSFREGCNIFCFRRDFTKKREESYVVVAAAMRRTYESPRLYWCINIRNIILSDNSRQFFTHTVACYGRHPSAFRCCNLPSVGFFGLLPKLRKATFSFIMSVCLSAWNISAPTGPIFTKFDIFLKSVDKI